MVNSLAKVQTLMSLFKKCSTMDHMKQIHTQIIQHSLDQNLFLMGKIIVFCAVSDRVEGMDYACSVFGTIENPDGFLWNTMIRGFGKTNEPEKAFDFYKRMRKHGEMADNFTFSFLLKVCGKLGSVGLGKQIHCCSLKHGFESHVYVRNTLIHMYGILRKIGTARQLFDEIHEPDLVAWNTIIDSYVSCGDCKEAIELFLLMLRSGMEPDEATLVVILSACSSIGELDFGRWVHSSMIHTSLIDVISVSNAVIDMYAKCGAVEEAYDTFNRVKKRNILTWNTMIIGLATHGNVEKALELFERMLMEKMERPDHVTFLGVLCACSHGGMVEEGRKYLEMMSKDYHIEPTIKHYGSMVDMLSRAGFVDEAYMFIRSMPMEGNGIIYRTLLAACRVHGNVELGEKVKMHLLEMEPDHSSDFVLLANMYASLGQWNETEGLRKTMKERGVQKPKPGNSFIGFCPNTRLEV